jgi:hypothetical protein
LFCHAFPTPLSSGVRERGRGLGEILGLWGRAGLRRSGCCCCCCCRCPEEKQRGYHRHREGGQAQAGKEDGGGGGAAGRSLALFSLFRPWSWETPPPARERKGTPPPGPLSGELPCPVLLRVLLLASRFFLARAWRSSSIAAPALCRGIGACVPADVLLFCPVGWVVLTSLLLLLLLTWSLSIHLSALLVWRRIGLTKSSTARSSSRHYFIRSSFPNIVSFLLTSSFLGGEFC